MVTVLPQAYTRVVAFQWTASPEPLTGYKLYYKVGESSAQFYEGTGLSEGSSPILLDKVTTFKMTGWAPNETYHFILTGYNERGESEYSTILTVFANPEPTITRISK